MTIRVAFLDEVDDRIRARIGRLLPESWQISFTATNDPADRQRAMAGATVAFVIGTGIDAALLDAAPGLKFVQKLGAGLDRVDQTACLHRGVGVARLQAGNAAQVAEHTVLMMLSALRRLPYFDRRTRQGDWQKEEGRGTQRQLAGKQVGLVGFGAIGRAVARRLAGFDVTLGYYDPFPADAGVEQDLSVVRYALDDLLARSDVISLHLPLGPETRYLLDDRRLAMMKPGATIINCARGGLIDEAALERALQSGHIFAAALDTFETEPPGMSPLFTRDDVVVTPHLAGATIENFEVVFRRGLQNAGLFLAGQPLPTGELVVAAP